MNSPPNSSMRDNVPLDAGRPVSLTADQGLSEMRPMMRKRKGLHPLENDKCELRNP